MLLLARIVRLAASVVVAFLVAGIGIHVFDVSTSSEIIRFIEKTARTLAGPFDDLFQPSDKKLRIALNWGLAAVIYGIVASLIAYLLSRASAGIGGFRRMRRT